MKSNVIIYPRRSPQTAAHQGEAQTPDRALNVLLPHHTTQCQPPVTGTCSLPHDCAIWKRQSGKVGVTPSPSVFCPAPPPPRGSWILVGVGCRLSTGCSCLSVCCEWLSSANRSFFENPSYAWERRNGPVRGAETALCTAHLCYIVHGWCICCGVGD